MNFTGSKIDLLFFFKKKPFAMVAIPKTKSQKTCVNFIGLIFFATLREKSDDVPRRFERQKQNLKTEGTTTPILTCLARRTKMTTSVKSFTYLTTATAATTTLSLGEQKTQ